MDKNPKSCNVCRYWKAALNGSGECRRVAPRSINESGKVIWPVTDSEDWCGSFGGIAAVDSGAQVGQWEGAQPNGISGRPEKYPAEKLILVIEPILPARLRDIHDCVTKRVGPIALATLANVLLRYVRYGLLAKDGTIYRMAAGAEPAAASQPAEMEIA